MIFDNGTLRVTDVQLHDTAEYSCEVITDVDKVTAQASITVIGVCVSAYFVKDPQPESNIVFNDSPSIVSLADNHLHHRAAGSDSLHPHMVQAQQIQRLCFQHIHNVSQTQKLFSNVHISYICSIKKKSCNEIQFINSADFSRR